jgi:uncharacterized protein (TIGR02646 family)
MIKLNRPQEPQILIDNKALWDVELKEALAHYGSISKVPQTIVCRYNHISIRTPLINSSHEKCAYCEGKPLECGNIEIDHFKPKSRYPDATFEWENMVPSCHDCNNSKGTHDTQKEPIINPYDTDPETVFYFDSIQIIPLSGNEFDKAQRTINIFGLNALRLLKPRAEVLATLTDYINDIKRTMREYTSENDASRKEKILRNLKNAISTAETTLQPTERYAGFCRSFLKNNIIYNRAKELASAL